ncbi:hypothetical protein [Helicobacter rodentium]|nr:hypothetical protein [Helicobacter rodentium]
MMSFRELRQWSLKRDSVVFGCGVAEFNLQNYGLLRLSLRLFLVMEK